MMSVPGKEREQKKIGEKAELEALGTPQGNQASQAISTLLKVAGEWPVVPTIVPGERLGKHTTAQKGSGELDAWVDLKNLPQG